MLRISAIESPNNAATLRLEGQLAGAWIAELAAMCERLLAAHHEVTLDLADVSFIDRQGLALLAALSRRSVALVRCSPFQKEQIRQAAPPNITTTHPQ